MIKKIIATSSTRVLHAGSTLLLLWLATNYLGSEQWGLSGIVLLDVSLILLFADMIGNSIVYYASRRSTQSLLFWSVTWLMGTVLLSGILFQMFNRSPELFNVVVPQGFELPILIMVFLSGLQGIFLNILLGKEKISIFNALFVFQFTLLLIIFIVFIFVLNERSAWAFVLSHIISYVCANLTALILLLKLRLLNSKLAGSSLRELLKFGTMTQFSSIVHLLNKRLGYYFISRLLGLGSVGVYVSGVQITEGLRLIGQSIALVQMSAISNSNDPQYARKVTIQLLKVSFLVTFVGVLILALIPANWFTLVFGKDFAEIKTIVLCLSLGVLALSVNAVFSHYFSGIGLPKHNLLASLAGFIVSIPTLFLLTPSLGMFGAAVSASLAYIAAIFYQWVAFKRISKSVIRDLKINGDDIRALKGSISALLKG